MAAVNAFNEEDDVVGLLLGGLPLSCDELREDSRVDRGVRLVWSFMANGGYSRMEGIKAVKGGLELDLLHLGDLERLQRPWSSAQKWWIDEVVSR